MSVDLSENESLILNDICVKLALNKENYTRTDILHELFAMAEKGQRSDGIIFILKKVLKKSMQKHVSDDEQENFEEGFYACATKIINMLEPQEEIKEDKNKESEDLRKQLRVMNCGLTLMAKNCEELQGKVQEYKRLLG